ncbi:MAG: hypothetical protein IIC90_11400 [Chloroflexi bacterium]|nr:hypothetical protein [Chloroflexota bacterium]
MPETAGLLAKTTAREFNESVSAPASKTRPRTTVLLAYGLQSYAELLLLIAGGGSIDDLAQPQLRKRTLFAIPIKQSAIERERVYRPPRQRRVREQQHHSAEEPDAS